MKVVLAEAMGMCFGVRDALAVTREIPQPTAVTVFGQLVHNPQVSRELERRGFVALEEAGRDADAVRTPAMLVTAHGISDRERAAFMAAGKVVIDTTCPLVRRAHAAARTLAAAGYFVLVIGKRGHVEVNGLVGDLSEGSFDVVEPNVPPHRYAAKKLGVIAQTTTVDREAKMVVAQLREMNPHAEVRFINTICQPTRDRQAALEALLEKVQVLVVVGGRHSNNTRQLVARAREAGVRALHVEDAGELQESMFGPHDTVGLTAGTSTLPETIEAVREKLTKFHDSHDLAASSCVLADRG